MSGWKVQLAGTDSLHLPMLHQQIPYEYVYQPGQSVFCIRHTLYLCESESQGMTRQFSSERRPCATSCSFPLKFLLKSPT